MISSPADRREVLDREIGGDGDAPALPADPTTAYRGEADQLAREAQAYYARKRYAVAEERVHRLLALQERTLGRGHPEYATGLCMLGELRFLQGDRDGADPLIREAVEVRRQALGERHPDYAVGLCCLAGLLGRVGQLDEAETHLRRALEIRRETLGEDHPDTIRNGEELERLRARRGEGEGADDRVEPVREAAPADPDLSARSRASSTSLSQPAPPPQPSPTRGQGGFRSPLPLGAGQGEGRSTSGGALTPALSQGEREEFVRTPLPGREGGMEALSPCGGGLSGGSETPGNTRSTALVESAQGSTARFDPAGPGVPDPFGSGVVATSEFLPTGAGSDDLAREMVAISYAFDDLRSRIVATARRLTRPGGPPPAGDLDELDACRRELQTLRERVSRGGPEIDTGQPPFEALDSLRDIAALLDVVREAERRRALHRATPERPLPREFLIDLARLNPIALPPSSQQAVPPAPPFRPSATPAACTRHFGKGVIAGPLPRGWRLR